MKLTPKIVCQLMAGRTIENFAANLKTNLSEECSWKSSRFSLNLNYHLEASDHSASMKNLIRYLTILLMNTVSLTTTMKVEFEIVLTSLNGDLVTFFTIF